jgi:hypothetical protein
VVADVYRKAIAGLAETVDAATALLPIVEESGIR